MIKDVVIVNFENLDGQFLFNRANVIAGRNGSGKTAIGRAILFAYTGRDRSGSQSTAHLIKQGADAMEVTVTLKSGVTISRKQTKTTKTVRVNGKAITNEEFEKLMPVSWDVFGSVFLPGFFDVLSEAEKRQLFMKDRKSVV